MKCSTILTINEMWGEFKVTDVKKETVSNMEIAQVTSPNPDSHEHTS